MPKESFRRQVEHIVRDRFGGNVAATARAAGVAPSSLSSFLSGKRDAGKLAERLAALLQNYGTPDPLDVAETRLDHGDIDGAVRALIAHLRA